MLPEPNYNYYNLCLSMREKLSKGGLLTLEQVEG